MIKLAKRIAVTVVVLSFFTQQLSAQPATVSPISTKTASTSEEIGFEGIRYGMSSGDVSELLQEQNVPFKNGSDMARYNGLTLQINEPIDGLPITAHIIFDETDELASITFQTRLPTDIPILYARWKAGLESLYGTPTLSNENVQNHVYSHTFCHTPESSINLQKVGEDFNGLTSMSFSGGPVGQVRNSCENAPVTRGFNLPIFPL